jgi:hypothetical protein
MRCVMVNGAKLKAETYCAHCSNRIGETYVREIGSRLIYCDYLCYSLAVESSARALAYFAPSAGASRRSL